MDSYQNGEIENSECNEAIYYIIQHIRTLDKEQNGWSNPEPPTATNLDTYMYAYAPYINMARERITAFLSYAPELIHSLDAELYLRQSLCRYNLDAAKELGAEFDYKAMNIVKYREVLTKFSKDDADNLPPFGGYADHKKFIV